jgi:spore coat protein U-like protein
MGSVRSVPIANTQVNEIVNEMVQNVSVTSSSICEGRSTNNQSINFGDIETIGCDLYVGNINQDINSRVSVNCLQSDDFTQMMNHSINSELTKAAANGTPNLSGKISNVFKSNFDAKKVSTCMAETLNNQRLDFGNIKATCPNGGKVVISDISQNIVSDLLLHCIQTKEPILVDKLNQLVPIESEKKKEIVIVEKENNNMKFLGIGLGVLVSVIFLCIIAFLVYKYKYRALSYVAPVANV